MYTQKIVMIVLTFIVVGYTITSASESSLEQNTKKQALDNTNTFVISATNETSGTLGEYIQSTSVPSPTEERIPPTLRVLLNKANNGDAQALFEVGIWYFRGVDIDRNIPRAIHYLTLASDKKHKKALYNLASLYLDGSIVEQDVKKGLDYLEKAVEEGYLPAQVAYSFLHLDGRVVSQDIEKAYTYITIASYNKNSTQEEHEEVIQYKNNIAQRLTASQIVIIENEVKKAMNVQ